MFQLMLEVAYLYRVQDKDDPMCEVPTNDE